ncbi:LOW QUALITY PROTEIN: hypothetical protein BC936DRAFT_148545, partial [Jimgerdemannia flammicorona]
LAPGWNKPAANLNGLVKVVATYCDVEANKPILFEVKGFPPIKVFPPELKEDKKNPGVFA